MFQQDSLLKLVIKASTSNVIRVYIGLTLLFREEFEVIMKFIWLQLMSPPEKWRKILKVMIQNLYIQAFLTRLIDSQLDQLLPQEW